MPNPFQLRPGLSVEPRHMALAQSFLGRQAPTASLPRTIGGGPAATTGPRPITSRLPVAPNMTSFVRSPEGAALMQRLLASPQQRRRPLRGTQVNPVGLA